MLRDLLRVFMDLGGKRHVKSAGGKKYPIIIRDDRRFLKIKKGFFLRQS